MCSSVTEDFGSHANFHNAIEVLFIGGRYRFFHAFLFRRGETVVLEATKAKSAMDYGPSKKPFENGIRQQICIIWS